MAGNFTYLDELQAAAVKSRKFRKDPYELPADSGEIKKAKEKLDPRFATDEELREFIMEFKPSDLNVDSDTFRSLPTEIQYELIQDLKLKSRQTSWARLDEMIRKSKTSLDFSKQQIQHLMHRNVMTQRLLDVNSAVSNVKDLQPVRIASERGKQYVLVKNEDVTEGLGWKLPGLHYDKGTADKPLLEEDIQEEEDDSDDDDTKGNEAGGGPKDKVLQAIESNPTLKRLLESMNENDTKDNDADDNDADVDTGFVDEDSEDDNELFVSTRPEHERSIQDSSIQADILDNMNAYVDDNLSIQEIMACFQSKQDLDEKLKVQHNTAAPKELSPAQETGPDIETMSGPELVNYWIKQSPDAFIYEHSLNDEYKHIIRDAVYTLSVEDMESKLSAISRKSGKLALHDELRQESFNFYKTILEETMKWKRLQVQLLEQFENQDKPDDPQANKMVWIDSDDDFEALDYSLLEEPTVPSTTPPGQITIDHPVKESKGKENEHQERSATSHPTTSLSDNDMNINLNIPIQTSSLLRPKNESEQQTVSSHEPSSINGTHVNPIVEVDTSDLMEFEESEDEQWQHVEVDNDSDVQVSDNNIVPNLSPSSKSSTAEVELFVEDNSHAVAQSPEREHGRNNVTNTDDSQLQIITLDKENNNYDSVQINAEVNDVEPATDPTKMDEYVEDDMEDIEGDDLPEDEAGEHGQTLQQATNEITNAEMEEEIEAYIADQAQVPGEHDGYNSEEELGSKLEAEDSEYARFVAEFGSRDYTDVRQEINDDLRALGKEQRRQKRDMDELTTQMIEDAQELLRLFGIPYIVSPMEAEAQCAELLQLSLVDGVVTDDSDVFLFGASKVYKNVFNQEKFVECYMSNDVERELSLDRQRLIQLAYLLGSDYTTGFAGVGQVAAMEILKEFQGDPDEPPLKPLQRFKEWWETPMLPKDETSDFRKKFRKRHSGLEIPEDFPNPHVREAYISPHVDASTQEFEWGMPDLDALRRFLYSMLGWDEKKVDGLVVPVIKEMNSRKAAAQASIGQFFDVTIDKPVQQPVRKRAYKSKRLQKVVQSLKEQDQAASKKRAKSSDDSTANSRSTKRR
ncbi:hypothetical protein BC943DRAFT_184973 [Umbelopsis sp. AD052]|nr:hypothetical protein BC943DRAFT_184973 [Umbelopsis sp. AD052]